MVFERKEEEVEHYFFFSFGRRIRSKISMMAAKSVSMIV